MLARDLYRLQQVVDRLRKRLADIPADKRQNVQLRRARAIAERDQVRCMLDGRLDR